ncbi:hypothetical protein G7K_0092-t1 [Saitoella complicata NRRL Y-17804]|uniref:Uncharacterized protein n=1 Tax=Saitoella complicata (strain BCRC 22490 / CBS 7301 / JCM 7358 / NBRC 10748 / NRRL Y-17804) TaxID=698492 RepID=A0A0E9N7Q0_SAICN|nr:hypothetical protein G7K_0092-t1 [Saitoella complicata NRRL Y-17804]
MMHSRHSQQKRHSNKHNTQHQLGLSDDKRKLRTAFRIRFTGVRPFSSGLLGCFESGRRLILGPVNTLMGMGWGWDGIVYSLYEILQLGSGRIAARVADWSLKSTLHSTVRRREQ